MVAVGPTVSVSSLPSRLPRPVPRRPIDTKGKGPRRPSSQEQTPSPSQEVTQTKSPEDAVPEIVITFRFPEPSIYRVVDPENVSCPSAALNGKLSELGQQVRAVNLAINAMGAASPRGCHRPLRPNPGLESQRHAIRSLPKEEPSWTSWNSGRLGSWSGASRCW